MLYVIDPVVFCDGGVLRAVFVLHQFFLATCSVNELHFRNPPIFLCRPEDKDLLEINPSAAPGDDGGTGLLGSALLFLSPQILLQEQDLWGIFLPGKEVKTFFFTDKAKPAA
jgi:hypothetical protein